MWGFCNYTAAISDTAVDVGNRYEALRNNEATDVVALCTCDLRMLWYKEHQCMGE